MKYFRSGLLLILLGLCSLFTHAQENAQDTVKKIKVNWENSDVLFFSSNLNDQRQVYTGNVIFRFDSSYMYCDSAYVFERDGSMEAFGDVRLEQGDTLYVYGDYLFYDNYTEIVHMRYNVRMVSIQQDSSEVILYADSLDYSLRTDIGYYFEGGRIVDIENELVSVYGQYSTVTKIAEFNDSVRLTNPQFILTSDTLEYSTETKIATILGPSVIESDSNIVLSSRGWYNTQDNTSLLLDRSEVLSGDKFLTGDSLEYDQNNGIGKAFGNIGILDTIQKMLLTGHYGYYEENTKYAFATDSACALYYSDGDSLSLHADTLEYDTSDSISQYLRAFRGVRFFRYDIQGDCDSMIFNTKDSVLKMYGNPVLWNENKQLFGDSIIIYLANGTVDSVHVPTSAFVAQETDPGYYDQLGGNYLKAYFIDGDIDHIDINGNVENIFYPFDSDSIMIGRVYLQSSSDMSIWLKEGKLDRTVWRLKPICEINPIPDLTPEQKTLKKFAWYGELRPKNRYDIFRFYNERKMNEAPDTTTASIIEQQEEEENGSELQEEIIINSKQQEENE